MQTKACLQIGHEQIELCVAPKGPARHGDAVKPHSLVGTSLPLVTGSCVGIAMVLVAVILPDRPIRPREVGTHRPLTQCLGKLLGQVDGNVHAEPGDADAPTRDYALFGVHAMTVNVTDGRYTYFRAPVPGNQPCYEYVAIPHTIRKKMGTDCVDQIEMGRFLSWTDYPVYKFPCAKPANIDQREDCLEEVHESKLFDLEADYGQTHNLVGEDAAAEQRMVELLKRGLTEHAAPAEQFERLGLA